MQRCKICLTQQFALGWNKHFDGCTGVRYKKLYILI